MRAGYVLTKPTNMFWIITLTAICLSLIATGIFRRLAIRWNIVDIPNTSLKNHKSAKPYLGGLGIFTAFLLSLLPAFAWLAHTPRMAGMLTGSLLIIILGLVDDLKRISPGRKLAGQTVAAIVVIASGLHTRLFELPLLDYMFTYLWLVGLSNAFNIIDIMDGLAGGVATITSLLLTMLLLAMNRPELAVCTAVLAGACIGFLKYNFQPARIFMGDCGSLFLGFILACVCIEPFWQQAPGMQSVIPLLLTAFPVLDTAFVSVVRLSEGRSPFSGDQHHLALRMRRAGLSVRATVGIIYLISLLLGGCALVIYFLGK